MLFFLLTATDSFIPPQKISKSDFERLHQLNQFIELFIKIKSLISHIRGARLGKVILPHYINSYIKTHMSTVSIEAFAFFSFFF